MAPHISSTTAKGPASSRVRNEMESSTPCSGVYAATLKLVPPRSMPIVRTCAFSKAIVITANRKIRAEKSRRQANAHGDRAQRPIWRLSTGRSPHRAVFAHGNDTTVFELQSYVVNAPDKSSTLI